MVASNRVQILTDKLEEIKVMQEFLQNPQMISDLEKEVVRLNQLTDQEESRLNDSKIIMQKKDRMEVELENLRKTIEKERADHLLSMKLEKEACNDEIQKKKTIIDQAHANLDTRQAELDAFEKRINQRESKLKEQAALIKGIIKD